MFAAVALTAALGAAATAQPGGATRELAPTATLASDGGAAAPGEAAPDGGVEAPTAVESAPTPSPGPVPVDAPAVAPPASSVPDPAPSEPVVEAPPPPPAELNAPVVPAEEPEPQIEAPTEAEVLDADDEPLVPVEVLSGGVVTAEETAPLIDIAPQELAAPPLAGHAEIAAAGVSQEDDGEVVIPVPQDDVDPDEGEEPGTDDEPQTPVRVPATTGPTLPLTGRELLAPLAAGLMLLLFGVALRILTLPAARVRERA